MVTRRSIGVLLSTVIILAVLPHPPAIAAPGTVMVTGTFTYGDRNPDNGVMTLRPIAFSRVEIWRFRYRGGIFWTWGHDASVTTDENGAISKEMDFREPGILYALRVFATNRGAIVWPNDAVHTLPFHDEPRMPNGSPQQIRVESPGTSVNFSFNFTAPFSAQHFNLAETVRQGFDYATARRDPTETDVLPRANVQPTSVTNSWYNPVADTVAITSGDVFSDFLILHEYAHFLEEQISSFPWIPSNHDGCIASINHPQLGRVIINSREHAWMEAFASYFAQAVGRSVLAGTLSGNGILGGTFSDRRLETPGTCPSLPAGIRGDAVELFVAAALWDTFDQTGDPNVLMETHDLLGRRDRRVFQIFDKELDIYGVGPTISAFQSAWAKRGLPCTELGLNLVANRIPLNLGNCTPIANAGPDQVVDERSVVTLDSSGTFDLPGDEGPDEGDLFEYWWEYVSGPDPRNQFPIRSQETPPSRFIAPGVASENKTLVISLKVREHLGHTLGWSAWSPPDEVSFTIREAGPGTSTPRTVDVRIGSLVAGDASSVATDDGSVLEIVSEDFTPAHVTTWVTDMNLPPAVGPFSNVRLSYEGRYSVPCTQSISVFRSADQTWILLDRRLVGTSDTRVSGISDPDLRINGRLRVRCVTGDGPFTSYSDFLNISFDT